MDHAITIGNVLIASGVVIGVVIGVVVLLVGLFLLLDLMNPFRSGH